MHHWATPIKSISSDYVSIPVQLTEIILGCFFRCICVWSVKPARGLQSGLWPNASDQFLLK